MIWIWSCQFLVWSTLVRFLPATPRALLKGMMVTLRKERQEAERERERRDRILNPWKYRA